MSQDANSFLQDPKVNVPFSPAKWPFFYGWVILFAAIIGTLASIPGQTIGVGVFKVPLLGVLDVDELKLAIAYGIGTTMSSLALPYAGKVFDRFGVRISVVYTSIAMCVSLLLFSQCDWIIGRLSFLSPVSATMIVMSLIYFLLRFTGQGCMTVLPRIMIGKWFNHRRGLAAGILGLFIAFGFNSSPAFLKMIVNGAGWSNTLLMLALVIGVGMSIFGWVFYRDNPESCGLVQDGVTDPEWHKKMEKKFPDVHHEFTRGEAVRTAAYWAFSLAVASQAFIMTAAAFHIETISENQGLDVEIAYGMFVMAGGVSVAANFLGAWSSDRMKLKWLLFIMMGAQMLGIMGLMGVGELSGRIFYIFGIGISGGLFGALSTIVWPRYYGRKHLGAIMGLNMSMIVFGSAVAPAVFSIGQKYRGAYTEMILLSLLLPLAALILGIFAENPQRKYT